MSKPIHEFPKEIGNPATNALVFADITTLDQVAKMSDKELLALHGVGPKAVRILREYIEKVRGCGTELAQ